MSWSLGTVPLLLAFAEPGNASWWRDWALPIAAALAAVVLVAKHRPRWFLPAAGAALLVLAVALGFPWGGLVGVLGVTGTVIWVLGLGVVEAPIARLRPRSVLRPALCANALAVGGFLFAPGLKPGAAAMAVAVLCVAAAATFPRTAVAVAGALDPAAATVRRLGLAVDHGIARAAHLVGRAVTWVVMVPVALGTSIIWVVHRIARFDPLRAPTAAGTTWTRRLGTDPHPTRYFTGSRLVDDRPTGARASALAVVVVTVALLAASSVVIYARQRDTPASTTTSSASSPTSAPTSQQSGSDGAGTCGDPPDDPVLSTQPMWAELACEQEEVRSHGEYLASTGYKLADFKGETVNVHDGVRRTWRPPACSCRRLTVWWFGGSAAWGEGQRDLYTLPSMLARAAWKEGIALDIENFAMPTYTFNQEVHRLAELTAIEKRPDLILSYGGGNDLVFQALRYSQGRGDDASDIALLEQTYADVVRNGVPVDPDKIDWTPDPQQVDGTPTPENISTIVDATLTRYRRNLDLAERLAASIDRPIGFVWQPLLAGSAPSAGPPGVVPAGLLDAFTAMEDATRARLPAEVIDMGGAFKATTTPVFFDLFHTGEAGAALMADQLLPELRPLLDEAQRRARSSGGN